MIHMLRMHENHSQFERSFAALRMTSCSGGLRPSHAFAGRLLRVRSRNISA